MTIKRLSMADGLAAGVARHFRMENPSAQPVVKSSSPLKE
jgi:hypothetical protein